MSVPSVYRLGLSSFARSPALASAVHEALDVSKLTPPREPEAAEDAAGKLPKFGCPEHKQPLQHHLNKSFDMHIGGRLTLPTDNARWRPPTAEPAAQPARGAAAQPAMYDPFAGLPLRGLADRLGETLAPMAQAIKDDHRRAQSAKLRGEAPADVPLPAIPSVLPFTRWAASSPTIRQTFVVESPKTRQKARLSWYHPDDTMVPRGWFTGGLLADLRYYNPFGWGRAAGGAGDAAQQPAGGAQ